MKILSIIIVSCLFLVQASSARETSLVVDVNRAKVLHNCNAKEVMYPASLTKMMTLFLIFDNLKAKKIKINTKIKISKLSSTQKPSKLGLKYGERITIQNAIDALVVKSANDVAVAVAEALGGSVKNFAKMMNARARRLGMRNTNFVNPHGWHHKKQYTTAYDMAKLAIALRKQYPQYYRIFGKKHFKFKGKVIRTHNNLLLKSRYIDGVKTGFTSPAGFNLVTSLKDKRANIIAVVMGANSSQARDHRMLKLLSRHIPKRNKILS